MDCSVGIDIGSQKTIVVAEDGERILTNTGGMTRPTIVLFGDNRLIGEEAAPELMNDNIVMFFNLLVGKKYSDVKDLPFIPHTKLRLSEMASGAVGVSVKHCGRDEIISMTSALGVYLTQIVSEIRSSGLTNREHPLLAFPVRPTSGPTIHRAVREACVVAGITPVPTDGQGLEDPAVFIVNSVDCLARAYTRKLSALRGPEGASLENKRVLLLEMGHMHTTAALVRVGEDRHTVTVERVEHRDDVGSFFFDVEIYAHLASQIAQQHGAPVEPGSKKGLRLLRACERLRVLLSQLPTASVTVENMSDSGDVNVTFTREELSRVCGGQVAAFRSLLDAVLSGAGQGEDGIAAVEISGGGMRMTIVQDVVTTLVGKTIALGAKLDDGSIAVGAALLAREALAVKPPPVSPASNVVDDDAVTTEESPTPAAEPEETFGLTVDELVAARAMEIAMQARDEEVRTLQACRNQMESYILDMRGAPNRKHGETIDREALNNLLNDFENWLWDNGETASLQGIQDKFAALRSAVEGDVRAVASEGDDSQATQREGGLCSAYIAATEADRLRVEENLAAEAALAAQQKAEDGEDEDHDFRKLKKADRMRLVVKNKEEGTELFKGGNIRPAAARYQKALTHAAKFFDLSPEDIEEVNQVKLSIFLNLAQCYLKLENWENAIRYSTDALGISSTSSKAYFRRAAAYEAKKDYDKALEDLKLASQHAPEDKAILKSVERVKRFIQKEKEKEKKMWGKAFS